MKTNNPKAILNLRKMILAFSALFILLISIAVLCVFSINQTQQKIQKIESQFQPEMLSAMELTSQLYHSLSLLGRYMLKHDDHSLMLYSDKLHDIDSTLDCLVELAQSDYKYIDKDRLMTISQLVHAIKQANKELLNLATNTELNFPAIGKASSELEPSSTKISYQINNFQNSTGQDNRHILDDINNLRLVWLKLVSETRSYLAFRNNATLSTIEKHIVSLAVAEAAIYRHKKSFDLDTLNIFETLLANIKTYHLLRREVITLHAGEKWRLDSLIMQEKISPTLAELTIELDELVLIQQKRIKDVYRSLSQQIGLASSLITGAAVLASIIISYLILSKFKIQKLEQKLIRHKQAEKKLWRKANYDYLTNLATRALFNEKLIDIIKADNQQFSLLFIDLDGFKKVNDTVSHAAGDSILVGTANRLKKAVRSNDLVARLGGDEFVILVHGTNDKASINSIAQKICDSLAAEFIYDQQSIFISCSIGIALSNAFHFNSEHLSAANIAERLLDSADQAMYLAKKNGKNGFNYNQGALKAVS